LFIARVFGVALECAVLLRWNITSNHRGGDNGLHGPSSVIHDAATI